MFAEHPIQPNKLRIVPIPSMEVVDAPIIGQKFRSMAYVTTLITCFLGMSCISGSLHAQETSPPITVKPLKNKDLNKQSSQEQIPEQALSKELMFKLLSSDIAIQRGEWGSAFVTLLGVAQETRDPRVAKKAAEVAMGAQQINEALVAVKLWR